MSWNVADSSICFGVKSRVAALGRTGSFEAAMANGVAA
jgi:hypothetical protein